MGRLTRDRSLGSAALVVAGPSLHGEFEIMCFEGAEGCSHIQTGSYIAMNP